MCLQTNHCWVSFRYYFFTKGSGIDFPKMLHSDERRRIDFLKCYFCTRAVTLTFLKYYFYSKGVFDSHIDFLNCYCCTKGVTSTFLNCYCCTKRRILNFLKCNFSTKRNDIYFPEKLLLHFCMKAVDFLNFFGTKGLIFVFTINNFLAYASQQQYQSTSQKHKNYT